MEVDPLDFRTAPIEALNFNDYELTETSIVRKIAGHINTMLDIGANIGWYSLLVASTNKESSVHAFEPIPKTFDRLLRHCHLNAVPILLAITLAFHLLLVLFLSIFIQRVLAMHR
nr:FkbM family methyltransferase [Synechococcus sp. PROS-7-1]